VRHVGAAGPVRPPLRDARQLRRLITTKATVTTASWQNMSSASTMCTGAPTAIAAAATPVRGRAHRPRWARARVRMASSRSSPVRVAARSNVVAVCGLVVDRHHDRPATAIAISPPTRNPLPMFPGPYSRSRRPPDTSTVIAAARPSARAIRCRVADSVDMEDLLNGGPEVARDGDGQRQGRVVTAGLDRVDGLPRDTQQLPKPALGQSAQLSELTDGVFHAIHLRGVSSVLHETSYLDTRRMSSRLVIRPAVRRHRGPGVRSRPRPERTGQRSSEDGR